MSTRFQPAILVLIGMFCAAPALAQSGFTVAMSRPKLGLYEQGEAVSLEMARQGAATAPVQVLVKVVDEENRPVFSKQVDLGDKLSLALPSLRLGFYRVSAETKAGSIIDALASRPAGEITYAVVPPVKLRKLYPPDRSFFGVQGGFNGSVDVLPYLGIRWANSGLRWNTYEPDRSGQIADTFGPISTNEFGPSGVGGWRTPLGEVWTIYYLPSLFFPPKWATTGKGTGELTPEGMNAWERYCGAAAKAYASVFSKQATHVYQITWEPNLPSEYPGFREQLVMLYQRAYRAIHASDPAAKVIGPTLASPYPNSTYSGGLELNKALLALGIGKAIDGIAIHPYYAANTSGNYEPEIYDLASYYRQLTAAASASAGRPIPIYGTEQGLRDDGTPEGELKQARGLIRANLIALGEGAKFNLLFYLSDVRVEPHMGLFYNLQPGMVAGANALGPKPIAPAFAAQSLLLDGHSARPPEKLPPGIQMYRYDGDDDQIAAIWTTHGKATAKLDAGQVRNVYDWMGNPLPAAAGKGQISVPVSEDPIYIQLARGSQTEISLAMAP